MVTSPLNPLSSWLRGRGSSHVAFVSCFWEGKERSEHPSGTCCFLSALSSKIIIMPKRQTLGEGSEFGYPLLHPRFPPSYLVSL